jgi:nitroimidazol reductase NimA-like FMN-containing flavoprotein (pyridoxamine 5'-phosphate oxidase superfamily)
MAYSEHDKSVYMICRKLVLVQIPISLRIAFIVGEPRSDGTTVNKPGRRVEQRRATQVSEDMSELLQTTARTKLKRLPKRGSVERETIYRILDEAFVCHVGFTVDEQPYVIPTGYARDGDRLLIHGSALSRMLRALAWEADVCVTVTLLDGLVLARSAFHHSMNYRSVVIFGKAKVVSGEREKLEALRAFTEHVVPGRWKDVRPPSENELKATLVLSLDIDEASAKIREGAPVDDEADYELDVWAGVIPLRLTAGVPVNDAKLNEGIAVPQYASNYKRD